MPLLNSLDTTQCNAEKALRELGPVVVILDKYCTAAATPSIWFRAGDQRNAATLQKGITYLDVPTQDSAIANKREQGKSLQLNMSLGSKILELESLALVMGTDIKTDATVPETQYVDIADGAGKVPDHYQVTILPRVEGNIVDLSFGWIMYYALPLAEGTQLEFSVNNPIEGSFSLFGEPHPQLGLRGRFYRNTAGADVADLVNAASEYTTAFPQA